MVKIRFVIDRLTVDDRSVTSSDLARFTGILSNSLRAQLLHELARSQIPAARTQFADAMRISAVPVNHDRTSAETLGRSLGEALVRSAWGSNELPDASSRRFSQQAVAPMPTRSK
jgi:hypothetical protein